MAQSDAVHRVTMMIYRMGDVLRIAEKAAGRAGRLMAIIIRTTLVRRALAQRNGRRHQRSVAGQPQPFAPGFYVLESWSVVRAIPAMPRVDRANGAVCRYLPSPRKHRGP
jgi:hypothetical protein